MGNTPPRTSAEVAAQLAQTEHELNERKLQKRVKAHETIIRRGIRELQSTRPRSLCGSTNTATRR